MMQVQQEIKAGWCVVSVSGRADGMAADELESALRNAIEIAPKVAADFSALVYISSAGLRAVLQAARAAQQKGVEFAVCAPSTKVKKVFDMSGLQQVLSIRGELPC